jgi:hypothetical protein
MGTCAGVDYNLILCPLRHIYHWHWATYARVDLNPMLELTLSPSQGLKIVASEDVLCVVKFISEIYIQSSWKTVEVFNRAVSPSYTPPPLRRYTLSASTPAS